jgi:hypothetical protein
MGDLGIGRGAHACIVCLVELQGTLQGQELTLVTVPR